MRRGGRPGDHRRQLPLEFRAAPACSSVPTSVGLQPGATLSFTADLAGTYVWKVVAADPQGLVSQLASIIIPTWKLRAGDRGDPRDLERPLHAGRRLDGDARPRRSPDLHLRARRLLDPRVELHVEAAGQRRRPERPVERDPAFMADVPGTYVTQLVVTDSGGFSTVYRTERSAGSCTPPRL